MLEVLVFGFFTVLLVGIVSVFVWDFWQTKHWEKMTGTRIQKGKRH